MVAGKRAEAQELAAKKEAEDMAAAQAVLGAGLKGYQQRKAARDERAKLDEGAKHIQAQIRGSEIEYFEGGHMFLAQDKSAYPFIAEWLCSGSGT